jgi:uncharacterized membrane-anchored protein
MSHLFHLFLIHGKTRDNKNKGYEKSFFMKMLGKIYEKVSRDTKKTQERRKTEEIRKNRRDTKEIFLRHAMNGDYLVLEYTVHAREKINTKTKEIRKKQKR